jgi:hypothetical protein
VSQAPRSIPLHTDIALFQRLFRRVASRGYQAPPWDLLDPSRVSPEDLAFARDTWAARMNAEYRAVAAFAELCARAAELGLPLEVTTALSCIVQDEARHVELGAEMSERLGGPASVSLPAEDLVFQSRRLPPDLFFARWAISNFCIGESSSVAQLQASAASDMDPCVAAVIDTLLRDEILHDRLGWALAALVLPRLGDEERTWLGADLATAFAFYEHHHAGRLGCDGSASLPPPGPSVPNLGVLPETTQARAFYERIEQEILPRLDALGLPAYEAWALRGEAPSQT